MTPFSFTELITPNNRINIIDVGASLIDEDPPHHHLLTKSAHLFQQFKSVLQKTL